MSSSYSSFFFEDFFYSLLRETIGKLASANLKLLELLYELDTSFYDYIVYFSKLKLL